MKTGVIPSSFVAYDLETTGLSCETDNIIQIAACRVRNGKLSDKDIDRFNVYIRPSVEVPYEVTALTGLNTEFLMREGIDLKDAMLQFRLFVGNSIMIAHNGFRFDSRFLRVAGEDTEVDIDNEQLDSLLLARTIVPGLPSYKLETIVNHFCVRPREAHRAQNDAIMLAEVLLKMYELSNTTEQLTLG